MGPDLWTLRFSGSERGKRGIPQEGRRSGRGASGHLRRGSKSGQGDTGSRVTRGLEVGGPERDVPAPPLSDSILLAGPGVVAVEPRTRSEEGPQETREGGSAGGVEGPRVGAASVRRRAR